MHHGRDALTGAALFLSYLAESGMKTSELRNTLPGYYISKNKITIKDDTDVDALLERVKISYSKHRVNSIDGVKIDLDEGWIHLRKSNTEAIIRIYTEAKTREKAIKLAEDVITLINDL